MAFVLVFWMFALVVATVSAGTWQLIRASKGRPLSGRASWLLWSAVGVLGIGLVAALVKAPFGQGVLLALLLGPLVPPAVRLWLWTEGLPYRAPRKREEELARLRYTPVDFAAAAAQPQPPKATAPSFRPAALPLTEAPLTPASKASRLSEATAAPESRLSKVGTAILLVAVTGLVPLFLIGSAIADGVQGAKGVPGRRAIVAAELEMQGYDGARLERDWIQLYCTGGDGEGYLWRSGPADGRACVWPGGLQIKVDNSRMAKDPFARPAR